MTTPAEKTFLLFLNFENEKKIKITTENIQDAINFVLENYPNDPTIPIPSQHDLEQLALQYIKIHPTSRTRTYITGPFGRAVAKKPLTLKDIEYRKQELKKREERQGGLLRLAMVRSTEIDKANEESYKQAVKERNEKIAKYKKECEIEDEYKRMGYALPAQRPPFFVSSPPIYDASRSLPEDDMPLCICLDRIRPGTPVAFCRYCKYSLHLECYNEMSEEQRKTLFIREGFTGFETTGVCNICHNGLTDEQLIRMKQRGSMDDPTYYRWPPDSLPLPSSLSQHPVGFTAAADHNKSVDDAYQASLQADWGMIMTAAATATEQRELQEQFCRDNPDVCIPPFSCSNPVPSVAVGASTYPFEQFEKRDRDRSQSPMGDELKSETVKRVERLILNRARNLMHDLNNQNFLENIFNEYQARSVELITKRQFDKIVDNLKKKQSKGGKSGKKITHKKHLYFRKKRSRSKKRSSKSSKRK